MNAFSLILGIGVIVYGFVILFHDRKKFPEKSKRYTGIAIFWFLLGIIGIISAFY